MKLLLIYIFVYELKLIQGLTLSTISIGTSMEASRSSIINEQISEMFKNLIKIEDLRH